MLPFCFFWGVVVQNIVFRIAPVPPLDLPPRFSRTASRRNYPVCVYIHECAWPSARGSSQGSQRGPGDELAGGEVEAEQEPLEGKEGEDEGDVEEEEEDGEVERQGSEDVSEGEGA